MLIATVLIIPSFVVTGIYSYNRMNQADNAIAKVGEVSITPEQFDYAKRGQLERLRQTLGENFRANMLESPEAREDILRALIDDAALMQTAAAEYVAVSEAEAIAFIKSAAGLQKDGKFSPELYQQFLLGQGKSDQQFVAEIQRDLSKEALVAGVAGTYPIPKAIVQQMHDILTEARFVRTMTFRATDHLDEVSVSDEEAKAYYDAHQKEFLSTEHIKAQYVVLSPENFRNVKINPEEIRNYYEQNLNRWTAPEERRASHILIDFGSDKAAALKKAEAVLAEVKADPKRFAELAKQESADTGSAEQGGDLDFFGRGIMTKPFEDAVFAAKKGDIVGPVETEFGYHVIYVTDVAPSKPMPFDEVKAQIEREYVEQMSIREFSEHADEFTNIVYEQSESLEPVAEKFGLKIETVDNVTREGVKDPALARIINEHVVESLYGAECLKEKRNSSAIEASANVLVAARVLEYHPTEELAFETVKSRIVQKLRLEKASEEARKAGEAKLAELKGAKDASQGFSEPLWVSRQNPQGQAEAVLNAELAVDAAKLPVVIGTRTAQGNYVLSRVEESRRRPASDIEMRSLTQELSSIYGEADRYGYLEAIERKLDTQIVNPKFLSGEDANGEESAS